MGVSLSGLIPARQITFEDLKGRRVAIDAYNTIYQFLSIIRDRLTGEPLRDSQGRVTSHLSGLFYRTARMIEAGIEPVFVFDGKPPEWKLATIEARVGIKKEAEAKWKEAVERGDVEGIRRYSMATSRLTPEMKEEAKRLLELMGVSWVQAPSEGEAQAAHMAREGIVWACGSQDWDSLLFGAPRFVRNLTVSGRKKVPRKEKYIEVAPEIIELEDALKSIGISREQLVILGILIGTDYNPGGVKGIGPKTALKLVKEKKSLKNVLSGLGWEFDAQPQEIFEFFMKPPVTDAEINRHKMDAGKLEHFLKDEHDFSEERIGNTIKKLQEIRQKGIQTGLHGFFGR